MGGKKGKGKGKGINNEAGKGKDKGYKKGKFRDSYDYTSKEYQKFVERLALEGLGVFRVDADGNCLFRSIAHQLWGDETLHHRCRQEVMGYIEREKEHFSLFMEDDEAFEDYVGRLKTNGEWGGNQEIFAAARLYKVDISIYSEDMPKMVLQCDDLSNRTKVRQLYLSFHGEVHYNSLIDGDEYGSKDFNEMTSKCGKMSITNDVTVSNSRAPTKMSKKEKRDAKKGKLKKNISSEITDDTDNCIVTDNRNSSLQREKILI